MDIGSFLSVVYWNGEYYCLTVEIIDADAGDVSELVPAVFLKENLGILG